MTPSPWELSEPRAYQRSNSSRPLGTFEALTALVEEHNAVTGICSALNRRIAQLVGEPLDTTLSALLFRAQLDSPGALFVGHSAYELLKGRCRKGDQSAQLTISTMRIVPTALFRPYQVQFIPDDLLTPVWVREEIDPELLDRNAHSWRLLGLMSAYPGDSRRPHAP